MKTTIRLLWLTLVLAEGCEVAHATDRYVATAGSDTNPGTLTAPFRTITKGVGVLQPGDTVYVRAGVYAESFDNNIPGGTSWSSPVTVSAYSGEAVTVRPAGGYLVFGFSTSAHRYIIINGFDIDASGVTNGVSIEWGSNGAAHHIRVQNCIVRNAGKAGTNLGQGILVAAGVGNPVVGNEFINLDVHDNGDDDHEHGIYIEGSNNIVQNCRIHHNAGWGVHVYNGYSDVTANNNLIRNNRIYDNATVGQRGPGIILSSGTGNIACNNVVWGNCGGIQVNYGAVDSKVLNNTVYANSANFGSAPIAQGIYVGADRSRNTIVSNNISYLNAARDLANDGPGTTINNNLTGSPITSTTPPAVIANNTIADPRFVDAAAFNFHLRPNSSALNAGATLVEVPNDFDGAHRPQGKAYDIGAYEYPAPNSDFNGDGKPDFLFVKAGTGQTAIWHMNGPAFSNAVLSKTVPAGWSIVGTGDFNDGKPDFLLFNPTSRATAIWYMNGASFISAVLPPSVPAGWIIAGVADFNGDDKPDILFFNPTGRQTAIWYMNGATFIKAVLSKSVPAGWEISGLGDFNSDGRPDLLLFNPTGRQTAIWYMNDASFMSAVLGPNVAVPWTVAGVADFNADGKSDLLFFNPNTRGIVICFMNGPAVVSAVNAPTVPADWELVAP